MWQPGGLGPMAVLLQGCAPTARALAAVCEPAPVRHGRAAARVHEPAAHCGAACAPARPSLETRFAVLVL
eukprot:scaffold14163_cov115-Isochrysis_galbana.AAC.2